MAIKATSRFIIKAKTQDMELEYFYVKTKRFAEYQGKYSDAEFPDKFKSFVTELPNCRKTRKQLLLKLIEDIKTKYESHRKPKQRECPSYCIYTIAYKRGIPFAKAELDKIHPINLFFDSMAEGVKELPKTLLKKITGGLFSHHLEHKT